MIWRHSSEDVRRLFPRNRALLCRLVISIQPPGSFIQVVSHGLVSSWIVTVVVCKALVSPACVVLVLSSGVTE
jgi:hypothetical protein